MTTKSSKIVDLGKLSDEELVKETRNGNKRAFEIIVRRYEQKIYNLAYRIVNNQSIAKDILQETFIKTYRSLGTFKGKSKFSTWVYRIALNFCLMHKRKKNIMVSMDNPITTDEDETITRDFPDWSDSPEATYENKEFKQKIDSALGRLPEEYKTVVVLRDLQGLSNREVGKILNISVPAVKSRVHRARMLLRNNLSSFFKQNYA